MRDHRGLLSRAEGCWTFDARDRMPRSSRLPVHAITAAAENVPTATRVLPRERVRSTARIRHGPRRERWSLSPPIADTKEPLVAGAARLRVRALVAGHSRACGIP